MPLPEPRLLATHVPEYTFALDICDNRHPVGVRGQKKICVATVTPWVIFLCCNLHPLGFPAAKLLGVAPKKLATALTERTFTAGGYGCMDVWMDGYMEGWMYVWMDGCMHTWIDLHIWMDRWICGLIDGCMHGWMFGWMNGWIDMCGWIDACMDRWMCRYGWIGWVWMDESLCYVSGCVDI